MKTQTDYENMNNFPPLEMDWKYSSMLVVVMLVMTYGPGIPILYLIACVYFFVGYWTDKILVFYYHRKPAYFNERLALDIQAWYKLAIVLHLIVGTMMLSNSHILPTK